MQNIPNKAIAIQRHHDQNRLGFFFSFRPEAPSTCTIAGCSSSLSLQMALRC